MAGSQSAERRSALHYLQRCDSCEEQSRRRLPRASNAAAADRAPSSSGAVERLSEFVEKKTKKLTVSALYSAPPLHSFHAQIAGSADPTTPQPVQRAGERCSPQQSGQPGSPGRGQVATCCARGGLVATRPPQPGTSPRGTAPVRPDRTSPEPNRACPPIGVAQQEQRGGPLTQTRPRAVLGCPSARPNPAALPALPEGSRLLDWIANLLHGFRLQTWTDHNAWRRT